MKILILGHTGMLGNMVYKYYKLNNINTEITNLRWDGDKFKKFIKNSKSDFLINCIASIPQKNSNWETFKSVNFLLPDWLSTNFKKYILHPTSSGEFNGNLKVGKLYKKHNFKTAYDEYGISKAISSLLLSSRTNVKQIRTNLIGTELKNKICFMEWFFKQRKNVMGSVNHGWNGITTLEWAKQSLNIIKHWDSYDNIVQISTTPISTYDLLILINEIFDCNKKIIPTKTTTMNRCIKSDYKIKNIKEQLKELKDFSKNP